MGLAAGSAVVVRLLSERVERLVAELRHAAATDPLTGLMNRRAIGERLGHELARARRSGEAFATLLIDVDHFEPESTISTATPRATPRFVAGAGPH